MTLLLPASALARQQTSQSQAELHGRTTTENTATEIVPGVPGTDLPEGLDSRFAIPPDAWPVPMPGPSLPHRGPVRGVQYDMDTGVEREFDMPFATPRVEEWLSGRMLRDEDLEADPEAFGLLSGVTSKTFPWSTHCRISFTRGGVNYIASGVLLDAQTVLTAGHCVHSGKGGEFSQNVVVMPAFDGDSDAFGSASSAALYTFTGWTASGDLNYDMGFIRLRRPVGYLTGWLGTFYNTSSSFWASTTFRASGFPGACFAYAPNRLYSTTGFWDGIGTNRVEANVSSNCWIGGMSGGGAYYVDAAVNRYCGATISYAWGYPSQTTRIGCNRMTQPKFDALVNSIMPAGLSTTNKDLVPLMARTGNTTIKRGQAPVSMSYRVFNHSLYNPSSATTNVSVYLSTNSTISTSDTRIQTHSFAWNFGVKTGVTIGMTPPVIPSTTAPGTYYLGILITSSDANNANNATSSWDAQRVNVTL
jgi:hypothetical protein